MSAGEVSVEVAPVEITEELTPDQDARPAPGRSNRV
jgi:hypothetical protein